MKKLFTLCLLVFSLSASAQWQQTGSKVRYVNGLGIPTKDTAAGVLADSSQILIRPADSSLYVKYKRTWLRVGGAGFTGSGTTNYIPKFTSSTAIGNSQIFDNGTNVGIGTASPGSILEIAQSTPIFTLNASSSTGLHGIEWKNSGVLDAFIKQQPNTAEMRFSNGRNGSWGGFMTFYTDVAERMRITSAGNVGIGETSPNGKLDVRSATGHVGINTGTSLSPERGNLYYTTDGTGWKFNIGKLQSGTFTPQMTLQDNGNVGIGTTSPATKFVISNAGASGLEINPTGGVSSGVLLQAYNRSTSAYMAQSYYALGHTFNVGTGAGTRAMDIDNTGNVGIGTALPDARLRVAGTYNGTQAIFSFTDGRGLLIGTASNGTNEALSILNARGVGAGMLQFQTDGTDRVRIGNSGNVMINTTTDNGTDRLQVSGSARVDGGTSLYTGIFTNTSQDGGIDVRNTGTLAANRTAQLRLVNGTTLFGSNDRTYQIFNIGTGANDAALAFQYWNGTSYLERFRVAPSGRFLINTTTDNASDQLQVDGSVSIKGIRQNVLSTTTTTTINDNNYFIDCTSGTFTVNLPASSGRLGRIFVIKNSGTGTITVDGNGAETIDGAATYSLATQWSQVQIISDGTNWKIISK